MAPNTRLNFIIRLIVINLVLIVAYVKSDENAPIPLTLQAFTVTQRLDHFNKSDTRLWEQRYFITGEYYAADGPVFILVSSDEAANPIFLTKNYQWMEWAKRNKALCVMVEQRFYGSSLPTNDLSLDSLKYFTITQSLEDLVYFRAAIAYKYKLYDNKWILFGGVYGGLLAINLRMKFPTLVDGVVASCTPVNFKVDGSDIMSTTFTIINKKKPNCLPAITSAVKQIEAYFTDGPTGWGILTKKFQVCSTLNGNSYKEVEDFYFYLAKVIYNVVVYNNDDRDVTIDTMCEIMNNDLKGQEIDRLAYTIKLYFKSKKSICTFESYTALMKGAKNINFNLPFQEYRKQMYNACTRNGNMLGSDDPKIPFYSKFSYLSLMERCVDIFGQQYDMNFTDSAVKATYANFGYAAIKSQLTNVLFVSGSEDPDNSTHVLQNINADTKAIVIQGETHCSDMSPSTIYDSPQLIRARSNIAHEISNWINS